MLRDGAGSSSDTRYALVPRVPAQVHGRSPDSTKNSPDHKKTRATTSARQDVEDRPSGITRVLDTDDSMDDNDNDKDRGLIMLSSSTTCMIICRHSSGA